MAGKIKNMIDTIISKRANGNPTIETVTRTKLILKGINTNNYTETSADDEEIIQKLKSIASELGINL